MKNIFLLVSKSAGADVSSGVKLDDVPFGIDGLFSLHKHHVRPEVGQVEQNHTKGHQSPQDG
jgi:hypothetical protein